MERLLGQANANLQRAIGKQQESSLETVDVNDEAALWASLILQDRTKQQPQQPVERAVTCDSLAYNDHK
jgi:hypothetical protein